MSTLTSAITDRERELGAIIHAYNQVTDQLRSSHEQLRDEVRRLREELARKNEQLRRRERLAALGQMAAGVAHEVRNPLGGIRLFASLLARDLQDRPAEARLVGKISKCVAALETIVSDILEFGRPSQPVPARVELGRVVSESIELASGKIAETTVQVEVMDDLDGIEVMTDGAMLQRALLNLLMNAIEASAQSSSAAPTVQVGARAGSDGWISITVRDCGPGIPAEQLDRIFNPFFTTKDNGVGLGLAIVHQIAEMLGGSVRAGNHAEQGAVFAMRLPPRLGDVRCEN